jgi:hypothetical protein
VPVWRVWSVSANSLTLVLGQMVSVLTIADGSGVYLGWACSVVAGQAAGVSGSL